MLAPDLSIAEVPAVRQRGNAAWVLVFGAWLLATTATLADRFLSEAAAITIPLLSLFSFTAVTAALNSAPSTLKP